MVFSSQVRGKNNQRGYMRKHIPIVLDDVMLHGLFALSLKCEYMLNRKKGKKPVI